MLIELLVALALTAIMAMIAIPAMRNLILNSRMTTVSNSLFYYLNYARASALNQKTTVQVCPYSTANSINCGTNWGNGFIVVTVPTSGTGVLLQAYVASIQGPILSTPGGVTSISFSSQGLTSTQVNFKLCDSRGATYARSLMVLPSGFVQFSSTVGVAVWDGSALTCP